MLQHLEELLTKGHPRLVQLPEPLYLRSDYVCNLMRNRVKLVLESPTASQPHLVLVLPNDHPEVSCVAQSSQCQVELLLAEPTFNARQIMNHIQPAGGGKAKVPGRRRRAACKAELRLLLSASSNSSSSSCFSRIFTGLWSLSQWNMVHQEVKLVFQNFVS